MGTVHVEVAITPRRSSPWLCICSFVPISCFSICGSATYFCLPSARRMALLPRPSDHFWNVARFWLSLHHYHHASSPSSPSSFSSSSPDPKPFTSHPSALWPPVPNRSARRVRVLMRVAIASNCIRNIDAILSGAYLVPHPRCYALLERAADHTFHGGSIGHPVDG